MSVFHEHGTGGVCFWCPGCDQAHCVNGKWSIDRDTVTITPSVLVGGVQWADGDEWHMPKHERIPAGEPTTCHSFVTDGRIQFLPDCTHTLAGQTVDLPDWPIG